MLLLGLIWSLLCFSLRLPLQQRIFAPGGYLYIAVPIGKPRLCFNEHRIHGAETICGYFSELQVVEFCGVHDDGSFIQGGNLSEFDDSEYAVVCF